MLILLFGRNKASFFRLKTNEIGGYQWPAVFEYKADAALFVLCETADETLCHIKLKFDSIVCILATGSNGECIITTLDGKFTAHAPLSDIIACLPQSKFAKIHWNEVLNLSMVDRIDGNIFYVGRASYSVDRKYAEDIHQTFMKVEKSYVQDVEPSSYYDAIFLRVGECYRRVRIEAIMWIESWHNYCDVHVNGSTKPYCSVLPLTAWQKILPEDHFIRLHRSLIINANYVDCIESKAIAIDNHVFTVPKAHRHLIAEYFLLFQRKKG